MSDPTTLVAGETLVDFIPDRPGALDEVSSFSPRPGGAPANVAVAMSRLDATPYFLTRLATDRFGSFLADRLADEGLPDRFVQLDPDRRTTLAFVTHDERADRSFTFYRENAADAHITPSTLPGDVLAALDRVVLGGVLLTSEPGRSASLKLADMAAEHDCEVVFDPNTRPELWDDTDASAVLESMFERANIVKTAADDLVRFDYPTDPDELADSLLDRGPHTVVLTRGDAGSALYSAESAPWGSGHWDHPGYPVDPVDTTGAGDAFLGGFLAALDDAPAGTSAPDSVLGFANAVAALTTTGAGAWTALPTRDAVREFRARHD